MANKTRSIFHNETFVDMTLYQFGSEICDPLHSYGPSTYNHFIFHYIRSGRGQLRSTDARGSTNVYTLQAGQGFLIWPKQTNTYIADEHEPWTYAWVEFDGLRAKELVTRSGLTFDYPVYIAQNDEEQASLAREIQWLTDNADASPLSLIGHLYLFMDALVGSSSVKRRTGGGSLRDFYVREALSYIGQHYAEPITVEDIAHCCNINRNYLGKIFRAVFDTSPQQFLIRYRLNKAGEMLTITERPIGEISELVGYPNQLNFSRTFKKNMGMSPRQWRQTHKVI